jgi:hypothetical protein
LSSKLRFEAERASALAARVSDLESKLAEASQTIEKMDERVTKLVSENELIISLVEDKRTQKVIYRVLAGRAGVKGSSLELCSSTRRLLEIEHFVNFVLKKNPLFDEQYYLGSNPDVKAAGVDPFTHYIRFGTVEGRNPSRFFDTNWYLASNADVTEAGVNPLQHFYRYGLVEGRDPHPDYSVLELAFAVDQGFHLTDPFVKYVRDIVRRAF